jgi:hypothetical protein
MTFAGSLVEDGVATGRALGLPFSAGIAFGTRKWCANYFVCRIFRLIRAEEVNVCYCRFGMCATKMLTKVLGALLILILFNNFRHGHIVH